MLRQLKTSLNSVEEVHSICSQRIKKIQHLNAYINVIPHEVSAMHANKSRNKILEGKQRILEGMPIAVKDNFCTKGITTTCASKMLKDFVPTYNATVVEKLLNSGAILMGKTNLDEFGMGSGTTESIFGPTKNIWGSDVDGMIPPPAKCRIPTSDDTKSENEMKEDFYISGGSSGGSAVAVASGTCVAALGSDTGGSVRNPASYCGVVGFKPSYGSVSRYGLIPLVNSMDVPGILTNFVDDCKIIFDVIKGWDTYDSTTTKKQQIQGKIHGDGIRGVCVGIPKEYHCPGLSSEVIQVWNEVADMLEQNGAKVVEVSLPHTSYSISCYSVLNSCEVASNMARFDGLRYGHRSLKGNNMEALYAATRSQAFNHIVRGRILAGNFFLLKENYNNYFVQALKLRRLIYQDYLNVWCQGVDVLLTPVTLSDAPLYSEFIFRDSREQSAEQDFCTQPANMAGIPALSLPIKLSQRGLPLSLQIMAPIHCDELLFDVGKFIETNSYFPHKNGVLL